MCCVLFSNFYAQSNRMLRQQVYTAEKMKDWHGATQYYQRLYIHDSLNTKLQYNYAEALRLNYDLDVALRLYNKVAEVDNGKKYPLTFYWIGQLLKNKEQYKEAKKWFTKFGKLKLKGEDYRYFKTKSKLEEDACDLAQIMLKNKNASTEVEHLDATVNGKQSEYAAFEKDSVLYFSSLRLPNVRAKSAQEEAEAMSMMYSKIYSSEIRNNKLKKIKVLDTSINSRVFHSANSTFNDKQTEIIFSRCTAINASEYTCELYGSTLKRKKWQAAVKLKEPVNQPSVTTTQPHLSSINGKTVLFFASNRKGGQGGLDIWYCFRDSTGKFSEPVNAGKKINTPDDDVSPWFVSENNTLYFSSTWHKGFGGFDVFKSQFVNGEFTEPENLGADINSSHNDVYYSESKDGKRLYLSSNRTGSLFEDKQNCCNDIYRFTVKETDVVPPTIDSTVLIKEKLKLLVPLTLYFHNDEPNPKTKDTVTTKNYEATFNDYLAMRTQYSKEFSAGLKGDVKDIAHNHIDNFFSDSVSTGMEDLQKFSDMLEKVLQNGETVKITMKGYCSPLASSDYNKNLAKRRISSLRNYFIETKDGAFVKYINNKNEGEGKIIFENVDIGELPVSKASDDFKDRRNSVFSPFAASERKIQIIAISFGK